jgi:hypothetical protein
MESKTKLAMLVRRYLYMGNILGPLAARELFDKHINLRGSRPKTAEARSCRS